MRLCRRTMKNSISFPRTAQRDFHCSTCQMFYSQGFELRCHLTPKIETFYSLTSRTMPLGEVIQTSITSRSVFSDLICGLGWRTMNWANIQCHLVYSERPTSIVQGRCQEYLAPNSDRTLLWVAPAFSGARRRVIMPNT